jgi:hypothetical protein
MGSMNLPKQQRGLFSRLPEDHEYWRSLTNRIVEDAAPQLEEFGRRENEWWFEMARYSTLLAVGAAAAVIAFLTMMPATSGDEAPLTGRNVYGLAPSDPLAMTLVSEETPPSIGTLIAVRNTEFER